MRSRSSSSSALARVLLLTTLTLLFSSLSIAAAEQRRFDIAAGEARHTLSEFSRQSNLQIFFDTDALRAFRTNAVAGIFDASDALARMLGGTGLVFEFVNDRTVAIRPAGLNSPAAATSMESGQPPSQAAASLAATSEGGSPRGAAALGDAPDTQTSSGLGQADRDAEVIVTGSRIRRRLADSVIPITAFDRQAIERTGATNVADVLDYIPQQSFTNDERLTFGGSRRVRLRGLGAGTTLVLVNGQRTVTSALTGASNVFDLNSIPLSAVERIEVLTDSASALYGSDAVGGVVNIILKSDIEQPEIALYYGAAEGGGDERRASLSGGLSGDRFTLSVALEGFERDHLPGTERERFADQDYRRFGGTDRRSAFANPGNITSNTAANLPGLTSRIAAVPVGSTGVGLTPASFAATAGQTNLTSLNANAHVVPAAQRLGGLVFGEYRFTDYLSLFGTVLYAESETRTQVTPTLLPNALVPANNPFNPFGVAVRANYQFEGVGPVRSLLETESLRTVAGLKGPIRSWDWELTLLDTREDGSAQQDINAVDLVRAQAALATTDPALALNVFQDGPGGSPALLASLLAPADIQSYESNAEQAQLLVRGPLFTLPAGALQVAVGAEARREDLVFPIGTTGSITPDRDTTAVFAEIRVPLSEPAAERTLLRRVDLTLAARHDDYSDFGEQVSPQYGLEWMPFANVTLHAAYGESFRAPSLFELYFPRSTTTRVIADPGRGNIFGPVAVTTGGSETLEPEESLTRSFGLVFAPADSDVRLRIGASYWQITQSDRIGNLPVAVFFQNEGVFADRVVRAAPNAADIAAGRPGQLLSLDTTRINAGRLDTAGVDGNFSASFPTRAGTFSPTITATWVEKYDAAPHPAAPLLERVDLASAEGTIPRWRAVGTLAWQRRSFGLSATARYTSGYDDVNNLGVLTGQEVASETLLDLQASWDAGASFQSSWFEGLIFRAGVVNATDETPEFSAVDLGAGYDPSQADTRQRFGYLNVLKRF